MTRADCIAPPSRPPATAGAARPAAVAFAAMLAALALLLPVPPAGAATGFVSIQGPPRLPVGGELRFGVHCRVTCVARVGARIAWPGHRSLRSGLRGAIRGGETRLGIMGLNRIAERALASRYRRSALVVTVRARSHATGAIAADRRVFAFRR